MVTRSWQRDLYLEDAIAAMRAEEALTTPETIAEDAARDREIAQADAYAAHVASTTCTCGTESCERHGYILGW